MVAQTILGRHVLSLVAMFLRFVLHVLTLFYLMISVKFALVKKKVLFYFILSFPYEIS